MIQFIVVGFFLMQGAIFMLAAYAVGSRLEERKKRGRRK